MKRFKGRSGLSAIALCASLQAAQAQNAGDWEYGVNIYFWGAGLESVTGSGATASLSFGDILDNLQFGLMGTFIARRDTLALFADAIYLNLENNSSRQANPGPGPGVPVDSSLGIKSFITTFGAGYNLAHTERSNTTFFGGARGLFLDTELTGTIGSTPIPRQQSSDTYWDAVVGVRGRGELGNQWALTYYADIGGGQSDFTWQGIVTVNYLFENWDLSVGYRHLEWSFDAGEPLSDLTVSGPIVGATLRF